MPASLAAVLVRTQIMNADTEELRLVRRAMAGDRRAFGRLHERYAPVVHAILLARLLDSEAARDALQDVFASALARLGSLRDPAAFRGWLLTIARNRATDMARRRRPMAAIEPEQLGAAPPPRLEAREALAAIAELPMAYRETLVMRLVEGMTGPEIAAATGLGERSVRVNLHRGMKMLRGRLRQDGGQRGRS